MPWQRRVSNSSGCRRAGRSHYRSAIRGVRRDYRGGTRRPDQPRYRVTTLDDRSELLVGFEVPEPFLERMLLAKRFRLAPVSFQIDRRRIADLGISLDGLAATLRAMIDGDEMVDLNVADQPCRRFR
ncbi:MAG: hypothetical protein HC808_00400 [Candidatus Competibacteraceae bacterium]|nr:hypothetical protein [Candidatus Competibacteraceae bacterium]